MTAYTTVAAELLDKNDGSHTEGVLGRSQGPSGAATSLTVQAAFPNPPFLP